MGLITHNKTNNSQPIKEEQKSEVSVLPLRYYKSEEFGVVFVNGLAKAFISKADVVVFVNGKEENPCPYVLAVDKFLEQFKLLK